MTRRTTLTLAEWNRILANARVKAEGATFQGAEKNMLAVLFVQRHFGQATEDEDENV